nr:14593_t:CDS:2 [Entrophospora candida]
MIIAFFTNLNIAEPLSGDECATENHDNYKFIKRDPEEIATACGGPTLHARQGFDGFDDYDDNDDYDDYLDEPEYGEEWDL